MDIILSSKKEPFKLERHALNAIKDKPGYIVEKRDDGFVGVKETESFPIKIGKNDVGVIEDYQLGIIKIKKEKMPIISDLSDLNIMCPSCGQSFYTTTELFDPDKDANPAMIELKQKYKDWGWEQIPQDKSMGYGCIVCPECGGAMAPSGKLRVE